MRDSENAGTAFGSETVDTQFWALICDDEEWLQTEFDDIVSEPAETPMTPPSRLVVAVDQDGPDRQEPHGVSAGGTGSWCTWARPGRAWRHQRSPPPPGIPGNTVDAVRNGTNRRW